MDETFTDTSKKPRRASAIFQAGSVRLKLLLDTNAMCELEGLFGCKGTLPALARIVDGSISGVRSAVYAMTRQHHPQLSIEAIGSMFDDQDTFVRAKEVLVTLIEEFYPPLKGMFRAVPAETPPQPAPATTPNATEAPAAAE